MIANVESIAEKISSGLCNVIKAMETIAQLKMMKALLEITLSDGIWTEKPKMMR